MRHTSDYRGPGVAKREVSILLVIGLLLVALWGGCGRGGQRVEFVSRSEGVKVSLRLPAGWAVEEPRGEFFMLFSQSDNPQNRGAITIYPAEGKDLAQWVDSVLADSRKMSQAGQALGQAMERMAGRRTGALARQAFHQKTISRTPTKIGKWEAIELVEESGEKKVITVVVKKGEGVCEVFFASVAQDWAENEPLFRRSLESLRIG